MDCTEQTSMHGGELLFNYVFQDVDWQILNGLS